MRYFIKNNTLFIRGSFRAAGAGISLGVTSVSTLLAHTIPKHSSPALAGEELPRVAAAAGIGRDYAGLVTSAPLQGLCVFQYDFITLFIMAGVLSRKNRKSGVAGITLIICSSSGMSDAALLETIGTAGDAKMAALTATGLTLSGSPTDAITVACEGAEEHADAGALSPVGSRVRAAILHGIPEVIRRSGNLPAQQRPAFFIFSRYKGEHWVEWIPENCPYYPCHFAGQRCDFCYCPLYPCGDETLGQWAESANGRKVWNCARCTMIHEPAVTDYLNACPEASKDELVRIWKNQKKQGKSRC